MVGLLRLQRSRHSVSVSASRAAWALQLFSCPAFQRASSAVHPVQDVVSLALHPFKTAVKTQSSRVSWPELHQQKRKP